VAVGGPMAPEGVRVGWEPGSPDAGPRLLLEYCRHLLQHPRAFLAEPLAVCAIPTIPAMPSTKATGVPSSIRPKKVATMCRMCSMCGPSSCAFALAACMVDHGCELGGKGATARLSSLMSFEPAGLDSRPCRAACRSAASTSSRPTVPTRCSLQSPPDPSETSGTPNARRPSRRRPPPTGRAPSRISLKFSGLTYVCATP
jgi:hypothetical protein